ncbi:MAG: hypothetical protein ABIJ46_00125 [bacterium]
MEERYGGGQKSPSKGAKRGAVPANETAAGKSKEKAEGVQPWLNLEREKSFEVLRAAFRGLEGSGSREQRERKFREWFLDFINAALEAGDREPLEPADVSSVFLGEFRSASASEIAGTDIIRSVVCFEDILQYQRLAARMDGRCVADDGGTFIPGKAFSDDHIMHQIGLIISAADDYFIQHEIRHSIDPHLDSRSGEGLVLTEAFALYRQVIVESDSTEKELFGALARVLKNYYDDYLDESDLPMSQSEFDLVCEKVVETLRQSRQKHGDLETQRMLAQSRTMADLFRLSR